MMSVDSTRVVCPLFQVEEGGSIPTSTLQLRVYEASARKCQQLNHKWHSVLPKTHLGNLVGNTHNVFYTAQFQDVYYAAAMWTTPVSANRLYLGWESLELRRFAIAPDSPKFTGSWMLAVMSRLIAKKFPAIKRLISYQAKEHHQGTIYRAAGWVAAAESDCSRWHPDESRADTQTQSPKVRWEKWLVKPSSQSERVRVLSSRQDATQAPQASLLAIPQDR